MISAREAALQKGEVWEKQDDGMGNVLYRNTKSGETIAENPIKRARRKWAEECAAAGVHLDWKSDAYTVQFKVCVCVCAFWGDVSEAAGQSYCACEPARDDCRIIAFLREESDALCLLCPR